MTMPCPCGREIRNVQPHLADVADWTCAKCAAHGPVPMLHKLREVSICPDCGQRPRLVRPQGALGAYCVECQTVRNVAAGKAKRATKVRK